MDPLQVNFCTWHKIGYNFIFLHDLSNFPRNICWKGYSFPTGIGYSLSNIVVIAVQSPSHVWLFVTSGLWHTRLPCPSPSLRFCPSSCSLHQWCHPTISSSDANSRLIGKVPDAGKDRGQKERRASEDEMASLMHGHELGQTLGDGEGQGGLACCCPWGSQRIIHDCVAEQQQQKQFKATKDIRTWGRQMIDWVVENEMIRW